jgi:hypothetical protein
VSIVAAGATSVVAASAASAVAVIALIIAPLIALLVEPVVAESAVVQSKAEWEYRCGCIGVPIRAVEAIDMRVWVQGSGVYGERVKSV